jgi:uncharacterized protein (DUF1499 family)
MIGYGLLLIVGVAALAVVVMFAILSATSRRPDNLGATAGRLRPCPSSPNCVCSQDDDANHHIDAIPYTGADPLGRMSAVVSSLPGGKVITSKDNYLHAEFTSTLFRFVDDVEFLVDPEAKAIQCRSASRAGHSDLGVNRKRVEAIRKAFAERNPNPPS